MTRPLKRTAGTIKDADLGRDITIRSVTGQLCAVVGGPGAWVTLTLNVDGHRWHIELPTGYEVEVRAR